MAFVLHRRRGGTRCRSHIKLRNGNGVRSTSRTNRMAGHLQDVSLSRGNGTTLRWAPSLVAQEPPSRFRSSQYRRRIWCLDWPHAVSNADAAPPARPRSPWRCGECSIPAATGSRPHSAAGAGTQCMTGSRLPPPARSDDRHHGRLPGELNHVIQTVKSWRFVG